jgi:asparagine synthase (glutamine-hydrolysing)
MATQLGERKRMCGIAGIIGNRPVNRDAVEAMMDVMVHRGPDDAGLWSSTDGRSVLGHRRLAIIDPTPAGRQPMQSDDGNLVLTYNGEIYNYLELAERLRAEGHSFQSQSDTEVLLAVYQHWGVDGFAELNGMFAFALYDAQAGALICARDRFGEKPFLYREGDGYFAFASEYKALFRLQGVMPDIDHGRLLSFLHQPRQGLDDDRETVFAGIRQLLPGEVLRLDTRTLRSTVSRYWTLTPDSDAANLTQQAASERFGDLLSDAVSIRMRSDVAVGSCLSGGLDSGSIVCLNRRHLGDGVDYHVFTGRFPETPADEWIYAQQVIETAGVESHETVPTAVGLADDLSDFIWHNELPVGSSSQYAQWCVFRLAKQHGITVLLDGQGADEILAGYEQYFRNYLRSLVQAGEAALALQEEPAIRKRYPAAMADTAEAWKTRLPFGMRRKLAHFTNKGSDFRFGLSSDGLAAMGAAPLDMAKSNLYEALREDAFQAHLPTLLRYGDRNSMAHSREVRLPFCDHRLAEFAFAQPPQYLMGDAQTKRLLRSSMEGILPENIRTRWNKQGFLPPQEKWFADGLGKLAHDVIESEAFRQRGYWDVNWWRRVLKRLAAGEGHLAWPLWKPIITEAWQQHFVDQVRRQDRHAVFAEAAS